jgi:hypothetical protein
MSSTQGFGYTYAFTASGFASAIPEPSAWAMMLIGFAGIGLVAYRRRKNAARDGNKFTVCLPEF